MLRYRVLDKDGELLIATDDFYDGRRWLRIMARADRLVDTETGATVSMRGGPIYWSGYDEPGRAQDFHFAIGCA